MTADYRTVETIHEEHGTRVLRAEAPDGTRVVVKTFNTEHPTPRQRARIRREFQLLRQLGGAGAAGVVEAIELVEHADPPRLILTDTSSTTLRRVLAEGLMDVPRVLRIGARVADGLASVHRQNIVHKDVKPSNILIGPDDCVHLIDFGIASMLNEESQLEAAPERLEGTLAYMPPEQTGRINRPVDHRSDLYSLGITLYEALTGRPPFTEKDALELIHGHIARTPVPPREVRSSVPEIASAIVMRLLEKDADRRYQSASGLLWDLEAALDAIRDGRSMELGTRDRSESFHIPRKLYGRERELARLESSLQKARQGSRELALVFGYSGIGKTALVLELRKSIHGAHGLFLDGKFDQFRRNIPYASIIQAFQHLVGQLLTQSEERIARWRKRIGSALGELGGVITDVIPEVELIIGEQPEPPHLDAEAARKRFNRVFVDFVGVFATAEHPLVLFLDDLQWADQGSLDILRLLTTSDEVEHLMLIGSYRDNEVGKGHPLTLEIARIRSLRETVEGTDPIVEVRLRGLSRYHLTELVADATRRHPVDAEPLSELLMQKTRGNPFFVHQFLGGLAADGGLTLADDGQWSWDVNALVARNITDNVVRFLLLKIRRFPQAVQDAISTAACLGASFDFRMLQAVLDVDAQDANDRLWEPLQDGLLVQLDTSYALMGQLDVDPSLNSQYRFQHDRVQQAAYELLSAEEKQQTHLRAARLLIEHAGELDDHLFDIADHFVQGLPALPDGDRAEVAAHLVRAGLRAEDSAAYEPAIRYLEAAQGLLGDDPWRTDYELTARLNNALATCEYLVGRLDAADARFAAVFEHAQTDAERAASFVLRIQLYVGQGRIVEALDLAVKALAFCGITIDLAPTEEMVNAAFGDLIAAIDGRDLESLGDLEECTDPLIVAALEIMNDTAAPAYYVNEQLYVCLILQMCTLSARYGQTGASPFGWALYGVVTGPILGDFGQSSAASRLARKVQSRFQRVSMVPKLALCLDGYVDHWTNPPRRAYPALLDGARAGLEAGDPLFATFCTMAIDYLRIDIGEELAEQLRDSTRYREFVEKNQNLEGVDAHEVLIRHAMALRGHTPSLTTMGEDEGEWAARMDGYILRVPRHMYVIAKIELLVIAGDYSAAAALLPESLSLEPRSLGTGYANMHSWLAPVVLAGTIDDVASEQGQTKLAEFDAFAAKVAAWADNASGDRFDHKRLTHTALRAALHGDALAAMAAFDDAIESAERGGFIKNAAIINELTARFYQSLGRERLALTYLRYARSAYERWGALAKVAALDAATPGLRAAGAGGEFSLMATATATAVTTHLDLGTLIKASQALAGEIVLDRVVSTLLSLLLENAGAQRALLALVDRHGDLWVKGEARADRSDMPAHVNKISERDDLALGVVNYVMRRKSPVVLADSQDPGIFASDPYILEQRTAAVLCAPVIHQGTLKGIIYLENDLTRGAFTADRVELLHILASQAAISIDNATLYQQVQLQADSFSRFVPTEFLTLLERGAVSDIQLGDAVRRRMTVMFSDIRAYTALSEGMSPEENFAFVNGYLSRIGPVVREHGGFIDKYMGDAIMALFPSDVDDAIAAAITMQKRISALNAERGTRPIAAGIGLHLGGLMLGIVGEAARLEGTVISDAVNVASRLEGLCKYFEVQIVVSEDVRDALGRPDAYPTRRLGSVRVAGREAPVGVFEVFGHLPADAIRARLDTREHFEAGVTALEAGDSDRASAAFEQVLATVPDDAAANAHLKRARAGAEPLSAPKRTYEGG